MTTITNKPTDTANIPITGVRCARARISPELWVWYGPFGLDQDLDEMGWPDLGLKEKYTDDRTRTILPDGTPIPLLEGTTALPKLDILTGQIAPQLIAAGINPDSDQRPAFITRLQHAVCSVLCRVYVSRYSPSSGEIQPKIAAWRKQMAHPTDELAQAAREFEPPEYTPNPLAMSPADLFRRSIIARAQLVPTSRHIHLFPPGLWQWPSTRTFFDQLGFTTEVCEDDTEKPIGLRVYRDLVLGSVT